MYLLYALNIHKIDNITYFNFHSFYVLITAMAPSCVLILSRNKLFDLTKLKLDS